MSDKDQPQIVVIRRHATHEESHHGGAWKIAFADFMTAMMALFLVLWLISSTSDKTKQTVAQYFNPVKLVEMTTQKKGFEDPKESDTRPARTSDLSEPESKADRPKAKGEASRMSSTRPVRTEPSRLDDPATELPAPAEGEASRSQEPDARRGSPERADEDVDPGLDDPFSTIPRRLAPDVALSPPLESDEGVTDAAAPHEPVERAAPTGTVHNAQPESRPSGSSSPRRGADANAASDASLDKLASNLVAAGQTDPRDPAGPRIEVKSTDEGLLISLTDAEKFSMFAIGSAAPRKKTIEVLARVATLLRTRAGSLVLRGHTDARSYRRPNYDNWHLSAARALVARDLLVRNGLDANRIETIEGHADRRLKNTNDPNAPENRRIEILLRKEMP